MARVDLLQDDSQARPARSRGPANTAQIMKIALAFVLLGAAALILYPQIAGDSATPGLPTADALVDLVPQPATEQVAVPPASRADAAPAKPHESAKSDSSNVSANESRIVGGPRAAPK
jgi:hypothetical protein